MSHMAKPFVTGKVKYFPHDDLLKAWDWVRNKDEEVTDNLVQETDKAESQDNSELKPYTKILVAIDFSAHSIQASKRAAELAKYYDAELTILHMVEERSIYDSYYNPIDMSLMLENQPLFDSETITIHNEKVRKMGKKHLQSLADKIGVDKVKTEVLGGSTASGIISYAAAQQTDLIVMGTHGRHGFSRIMGSVARSVQGGAHCEVLIVPLQ
jgi:universal stress protein A